MDGIKIISLRIAPLTTLSKSLGLVPNGRPDSLFLKVQKTLQYLIYRSALSLRCRLANATKNITLPEGQQVTTIDAHHTKHNAPIGTAGAWL